MLASPEIALLCDFDETVIQENMGVMLLERFGEKGWERFFPAYLSGSISLRECITSEYSRLRASRQQVQAFARDNGSFRPGFRELVSFCQNGNIPLVIVSGGLSVYVETFLAHHGLGHLPVFSEKAVFRDGGVSLAGGDANGHCLQGNSCKCLRLESYRSLGHKVLYIGDGSSDLCPAEKADLVFARGKLLEHCRAKGLDHQAFEDFYSIISGITALRSEVQG